VEEGVGWAEGTFDIILSWDFAACQSDHWSQGVEATTPSSSFPALTLFLVYAPPFPSLISSNFMRFSLATELRLCVFELNVYFPDCLTVEVLILCDAAALADRRL
jgi:hypothetical protein